MTRAEFLSALRMRLADLPAEEIESALRYYEEYFDEAASEEEAFHQLGTPEQIAARILADVARQDAAQPAPLPASAAAEQPTAKRRSPWQTAGLVVLLVCASPLLISLGSAALSIVIALLSVLLSVIVAIIAPFLTLSIAFIALFFVLMYWAGRLMGVFMPGTVLLCGLALLCGALGIACCIFTGYLFKWTGLMLKELFGLLKFKKKGATAA